jgi:Ni,Fe-hydrogenase III component G
VRFAVIFIFHPEALHIRRTIRRLCGLDPLRHDPMRSKKWHHQWHPLYAS